jgi:hypothetical protein
VNLDEQIRRLTEAGKTQKEITQLTGKSRGTVHRRQKLMGLTPPYRGPRKHLPEAQVAEVLDLLKHGRGTSWIGKHLGIGEHPVRQIVKRFNFRRKRGEVGYRYHLSPTKRAKIIEEIREHRNFALQIAWKYRVAYKIVLRLAREELGCERFRCGYGQPALSSNFPQKNHTGSLADGLR